MNQTQAAEIVNSEVAFFPQIIKYSNYFLPKENSEDADMPPEIQSWKFLPQSNPRNSATAVQKHCISASLLVLLMTLMN